jgi:hypothetical protein
MQSFTFGLAAATAGLVVARASGAAPPPPPPPGAIERAEAVLHVPRHGELAAYVDRFSRNVVLDDGVAPPVRGHDALLRYLRERQLLRVEVLEVSYGNPIMAAERVSNFPEDPRPGAVYDCCFWARMAIYHLDEGGRVDRVQFVENGAYWGPPERPR